MRAILSFIVAVTLVAPLHDWQVLPADKRSNTFFTSYEYDVKKLPTSEENFFDSSK